MSLILTPIIGIPLIRPGDNLAQIIYASLLQTGIEFMSDDILVIAQKIVSKAENRLVNLTTVIPSEKASIVAVQTQKDPRFIELVLRESKAILRTRPGTIIVEHRCGFVCANAGIDHSNVQGLWGNPEDWFLLLPEDPDSSARRIGLELENLIGHRLGILIIDSHGRAWRMGTVGVTIGLWGVPGLVDLRGSPDLFGYHLKITQVGAADELAAAASLVMGQAAEATPVIHVRGFPYALRESHLAELIRSEEQDLFR